MALTLAVPIPAGWGPQKIGRGAAGRRGQSIGGEPPPHNSSDSGAPPRVIKAKAPARTCLKLQSRPVDTIAQELGNTCLHIQMREAEDHIFLGVFPSEGWAA